MGFGAAAIVFAILWHGTQGPWSIVFMAASMTFMTISVFREAE
jgi:hypothetical protein